MPCESAASSIFCHPCPHAPLHPGGAGAGHHAAQPEPRHLADGGGAGRSAVCQERPGRGADAQRRGISRAHRAGASDAGRGRGGGAPERGRRKPHPAGLHRAVGRGVRAAAGRGLSEAPRRRSAPLFLPNRSDQPTSGGAGRRGIRRGVLRALARRRAVRRRAGLPAEMGAHRAAGPSAGEPSQRRPARNRPLSSDLLP